MAEKKDDLEKNTEKARDKYKETLEELQKIYSSLKYIVKETDSFQKAIEKLNKELGFTLVHTKQVEKSFEEQYEDFKKIFELQKQRNDLEKIFLDDLNQSIHQAIIKDLEKNLFLLDEQKSVSQEITNTVKDNENVIKKYQNVSKDIESKTIELVKTQQEFTKKLEEQSETKGQPLIEMYDDLTSKIVTSKTNLAKLHDVLKDSQSNFIEIISSNLKNLDNENKEFFENLIKSVEKINKIKVYGKGFWGTSRKEMYEAISFLKEKNLISDEHIKKLSEIIKITKQINEIENKLAENTKKVNKIFIANSIADFVQSKVGFKFIDTLTEIDDNLSLLRRNTSILLKDINSIKLSDYLMDLSQFNIGIKEAAESLTSFSDVLKTTNVEILTDLTKKFAAMEMAIGVSSKTTSVLVGELTKSRVETGKIKSLIEKTNQATKILGLNTKAVVENLSEAVVKMRQLGWTSVESMKNLTIFAERYRMSMSDIYSMAEKTRTLEGSIEAASKLQLAGGLGTYLDPIQLLSAARKGGEELENVIKNLAKDIGRFNEEGEFIFDAVDVDRLKIISEATGLSIDSLQEKIRKSAEMNRKMKFLPDISFEGIIGPDGKPMKPEEVQSWIAESIGKNGEILQGSALDMAGVKDLSKLTKEQIQTAFDLKKKTLEEEAALNKSFNESVESFKKAIKSLVAIFEPLIKVLTRLIDFLAKHKFIVTIVGLIGAMRVMTPVLVSLVKALSVSKLKAIDIKKFLGLEEILPEKEGEEEILSKAGGGKGIVKNLIGKVKGLFGFKSHVKTPGIVPEGAADVGKEIQKTEKITKATEDISKSVSSAPAGISKKSSEVSMGLRRLSSGFSSFGKRVTESDIRKVRQAAFSLSLFTLAIPALTFLAFVGRVGNFITSGLRSIARGISAFGQKPAQLTKGLLMLGLSAIVLGAITAALVLFSGISWKGVFLGIAALALFTATLIGIGAAMTNPVVLTFFAIGLAAMAAMSVVILAFAAGLHILSNSLRNMEGINYTKIFTGLKDLMSSFSSMFSFGLIDMLIMSQSLKAFSNSLSTLDKAGESFGNSADNLSRFNSSLQEFITLIRSISDDDLRKFEELSKTNFNKELKVILEDNRERQPINVQITLPGGRVIYEQIIKDIERKS